MKAALQHALDLDHTIESAGSPDKQAFMAVARERGVLARVLAEMNYGGVVAACELAGGADLPTTVVPFILRGVKLIGVDSVMLPSKDRLSAWQRIVLELPLSVLDGITSKTVALTEVGSAAADMLAGKFQGRVLVDVN